MGGGDARHKMRSDPFYETPKYDIPYSGIQWWIRWYPIGVHENGKDYISVYLHVNKPVKAKFTVSVGDLNEGTQITNTCTSEFHDAPSGHGFSKFMSRESHYQRITFTCNVELEIPVPLGFLKPATVLSCEHLPTDFELVLESKSIPVHKHFLSMLSPVFHAMLTHNTIEAKSGKHKITDFDYDTVKTAIDFCYGRDLEDLADETVCSILRFADKYDIKAILDPFEKYLFGRINLHNFCSVVDYAWKYSREDAKKACAVYLNANRVEVTKLKSFAILSPEILSEVLQLANNL